MRHQLSLISTSLARTTALSFEQLVFHSPAFIKVGHDLALYEGCGWKFKVVSTRDLQNISISI